VKRFFATFFLAFGSISGCSQQDGPSLYVEDVRILAPLPASGASVAYFRIVNGDSTSAKLVNISSPQFGQVAMHETKEEEGVARMRPVAAISIPGNDAVEFASGGLHVMLMNPEDELHPGSSVTLQLQFENNLLIVSSTLQARRAPQ